MVYICHEKHLKAFHEGVGVECQLSKIRKMLARKERRKSQKQQKMLPEKLESKNMFKRTKNAGRWLYNQQPQAAPLES